MTTTAFGHVAACLTREVGLLRPLAFLRVNAGESNASGELLLRVEGFSYLTLATEQHCLTCL